MLSLGEGFIPSPTPSRGLVLEGSRVGKAPILTQNGHLENIDFRWFRMGHPSTMEILESPQGGNRERGRSLKTAFSHEASLKNCSRKPAFFLYLIFFEILKTELSPTRELYFCCFQNCLGRLFLVREIYKIAILPAWQPCFREVNVQKTKHLFFFDFLKILVFPMFF